MSDVIGTGLDAIYSGTALPNELENGHLDFKRASDSVRDTENDMADAAACFANAGGGTVILGVQDAVSGLAAFLGTTLNAADLRRRIHDVTQPHLDVRVDERVFRGFRLLQITVQEGLDVHVSRGKVPTRRFLDRCEPMSSADISRVHDERRGSDWSDSDSGRPSSDADQDAMLRVRALLRRGDESSRRVGESSDEDMLASLGLLTNIRTLNRAGELLVCAAHDGTLREVLVYQHRETMGGEVDGGRRWSGPLVTAITEALAYIEARLGTTPINLSSGQQLQIEDFPLVAVREAIANAAMHGDHRDHRAIYVEHSPEALEVRSPGPLVTGISPANILTHPPKSRFPALADAMRSLGLAERWGQGVDRMYREMIRSGKSVPLVSVQEGQEPETTIRFMGGPPNARIAKFIATLPQAEQNDTDALIVISLFSAKKVLSARDVAPMVQRDEIGAQAVLHRLATGEAELLEPTPRTLRRSLPDYRLRSSAVISLGPALTYASRPTGDRDKKVFEHIREYGSINNATVQRLFDVDVYQARDILKNLVGREVVIRTSEQRRGTAVRYGAGPKFPTKKAQRDLGTVG